MKIFTKVCFLQLLFCLYASTLLYAQSSYAQVGFGFSNPKTESFRYRFELYNNLIILPFILNHNTKDTLNFILDTGVSTTIITDASYIEKLGVTEKNKKISVRGVGANNSIDSYVCIYQHLNFGKITAQNQTLLVLSEDIPELSEYAGIKVHGIVGYDIFSRFMVKIDYERQLLTFYEADKYRSFFKHNKRYEAVPLELQRQKPYIRVEALSTDSLRRSQKVPLKVLIDTGAGFSLSVEPVSREALIPAKTVTARVGTGISGVLMGAVGRIGQLQIGPFAWKQVITSFIDNTFAESIAEEGVERQGSLGMGILSRFSVVFDYAAGVMYLRPNKKYNEKFLFNVLGFDIIGLPPRYNRYIVKRVYQGSNAFEAGLMEGDELVSIDARPLAGLKIGEVYALLEQNAGTYVFIVLLRKNQYVYLSFYLEKST